MNQEINDKEKELQNLVFIMCVLWFITAIICGRMMNDNTDLEEMIERKNDTIIFLRQNDSLVHDTLNNEKQLKLHLRGYINGSNEVKLRNDSTYMYLNDKSQGI